MATKQNPEPDNPNEKRPEMEVPIAPGESTSFEVPPNTNLVVNIVGNQRPGGGGCSAILSGCGCAVVGFVLLFFVLAACGSLAR